MAASRAQLVLKENDVFIVTDEAGHLPPGTSFGLYYEDTRYLSVFNYQVNGHDLELLNASSGQNYMGKLYLANDWYTLPDGTQLLPQTLSLSRERFVRDGLHERNTLTNYNPFPVPVTITVTCGADFRDMFDVRGFERTEWGTLRAPTWENGLLTLGYDGLDGLYRATVLRFDPQPGSLDFHLPLGHETVETEPSVMLPVVSAPTERAVLDPTLVHATWTLTLEPGQSFTFSVHVCPQGAGRADCYYDFDAEVLHVRRLYDTWGTDTTRIRSDSRLLDQILNRSSYDLRVLSQVTEGGYFPHAGVPWYVAPFGRDSLIVGLQTLMFNPKMASATLRVLARYQGTKEDPWREEQPGKILHEMRFGEMARLHMVPHTPYYGTVDATPLFVWLFAELLRWIDDDALYHDLLPNVRRALEWIDRYGDVDGDGFIEYIASTNRGGIRNQAWKDSNDSYTMPDGSLAETPLASSEVQGYVYAAKQGLSHLLRRKGETEWADALAGQAAELKRHFNEAFWMPDVQFIAEGLEAAKRPIPNISSNAGQCLWTGIVDDDKAALVAARLLEPDMLSGWGIRTISTQSGSYNPMSYHNGSIWPHDNSLIVAGLARYGFHAAAAHIATQLFEAATHFPYSRLPELYCGFARDESYQAGPAEYPVSCSPQAWAAAAPLILLQSLLKLQPRADGSGVDLDPDLPSWLNAVHIENLQVGGQRLRVDVVRRGGELIVEQQPGDPRS
jgi:glycogen debranching enzyme